MFVYDMKDFNVGLVYGFECINIFIDDGWINESGGFYVGQKWFDVWYLIQEDLKSLGLFVDKKDNLMIVLLLERSKDVVEFRMKFQWWIKMFVLVEFVVVFCFGNIFYIDLLLIISLID